MKLLGDLGSVGLREGAMTSWRGGGGRATACLGGHCSPREAQISPLTLYPIRILIAKFSHLQVPMSAPACLICTLSTLWFKYKSLYLNWVGGHFIFFFLNKILELDR